jgi:hypothetical protein
MVLRKRMIPRRREADQHGRSQGSSMEHHPRPLTMQYAPEEGATANLFLACGACSAGHQSRGFRFGGGPVGIRVIRSISA